MALMTAKTDDEPLFEINTTPLIDVMLVLLITLIVTMPPATHSTNMNMGRGLTAEKRESVAIDIDFDGSIYWNGAPIEDFAQLERYLRVVGKETMQPDVRINANRRVRYDVVALVLAAAQRSGADRIGFVGQERFVE